MKYTLHNKQRIPHSNRGFSLLEMVVYVAILSAIAVIVVTIVLSFSASWNSLRISRDINASAMSSFERIGRDLRAALDVNTAGSVLNAHPGALTLSDTLQTEFFLDGGVLRVRENSVDTGALTKESVTVTNLVFRFVTSGSHRGVRIEMTLEGVRGAITKTESFVTFIALRAPYL